MDFFHILMPISGVSIFWPGLIILGLGVGIIGGFFGMGGAWMVTPGLNILGFPMAFAIGTDMAHMAGKSLISTFRHGKFGNVDYKLGLVMLGGTVIGMEIGAQIIVWLERLGSIDVVVRWLYVVLLSLVIWLIFHDIQLRRKKEVLAKTAGQELADNEVGIEWPKKLQKIKIPPMVHFKTANIHCSIWVPVSVSLITGLLAGLLGIGGGLIRMPALIYMVGCPTHVAVGTDLFEVAISGIYGAATYTFKGRTELSAALIMLVGAAIGAQIGALATKYIYGYGIRIAFAAAVAGCLISVVLKLLQPIFPDYANLLNILATITVLGFVSCISIYITVKMILGASAELTAKKANQTTG